MALADIDAFRAFGPEFNRVLDPQLQEFLDLAAVSVPSDPWGDHQREGHLYLTAHLLAQSPFGQGARLENEKDANTSYGDRYARLKKMVACGTRVI